jgi:hypothetical protein
MRFIGMNGMLVLVPAAFFLHSKATVAEFDALFYAVQAVELVAGAVQLAPLGGNLRDGLRLAGRPRSFPWRAFGSAQCACTRREGLIALLKGDDDANLH